MVTEEKVWEVLKQVLDPELNFNVVDLGLVYKVEVADSRSRSAPAPRGDSVEPGQTPGVEAGQDVKIEMTMTTPFCPYAPALLADAKDQLSKIKGMGNIEIEVVWEPPWSLEKVKMEIREQLGLF